MQQEELARLFSNNLTLSSSPAPPPQYSQVEQPPQQQQQEPQVQQEHQEPSQQAPTQQQAPAQQPIIYASQHYTHTHHVVPIVHKPRPIPTPLSTPDLVEVLLRNSIDPTLLFPSQVSLFQNADEDQRLRLLELWRISPPQGRQGIPDGIDYNTSRQLYDWPPTSLAQEEAMAKLRYERQVEEDRQKEDIRLHEQRLQESMDADSAAVAETTRNLLSSPERQNAEPYILSGYEALAAREYERSAQEEQGLRESTRYNQAIDPVYKGNGSGLWEKHVGVVDMENQYGEYEHMREYASPNPQVMVYGDDDMIM
ncbi:uncharacterized protein BDZ99DRAFT_463102 [Mytilinidion resinicola]|uniref:Uncharacterized protein n=1 Tax=Mytilinidion resinicola TaxID=574789 RepID=A0A6A6YNU0_9PEZI|nr:uncharacterized protein BDZ99DRAFT_463102 [Mytilinidion resinicola]KAF2810542.1 hypothetical protein BDZ99DRAFT_463102 [Mytilinidion resinicola]